MAVQRGLSPSESIEVSQGEVVPVEAVLEVGQAVRLRWPVGGYVRRGDVMCFVPTVDIVGLAAVTMGIYTGLRTGMRAIRAAETWLVQRR